MHLEIFVLAVLTASALGQRYYPSGLGHHYYPSGGHRGPFNCPTCEGKTLQECDANIRQERCRQYYGYPVCILLSKINKEGQPESLRRCYTKSEYRAHKGYCDEDPTNCNITMCGTSDCKAEPGPVICPTCQGKTVQECNAKIKQERCPGDDPVCALLEHHNEISRSCLNRDHYEHYKLICDRHPTYCNITMCGESDCKIDSVFKCPTCTARGKNAKAECDANVKLENCTQENPVCEITKYIFGRIVRQCSSEADYKTSLSNCEKQQNCRKAMCKESECMAEIPPAFICPKCSGKSPEECNENIKDTECQGIEDPVCAFAWFASDRGIKYERKCISKSNFKKGKEDCARNPGKCFVAICEESGCKAAEKAKYQKIGCFKDKWDRAIPSLEEHDPTLGGDYQSRKDAIDKCYQAAKKKGFHIFAVQHGGQCLSSATASKTFDKYGKSSDCESDGEGGPFANQVYYIPTEPFMCPICSAEGENSNSECEDNIENRPCLEVNPVCALTIGTASDDPYTARGCYSKQYYQKKKALCEYSQDCKIFMCETSGCKAQEPLSCPICYGETLQECDAEIEYAECWQENPVCILFEDQQQAFRTCFSKEEYNENKGFCEEDPTYCNVTMCDKSGCKAEWENSEPPFSCPTCEADTLQNCDADIKEKICSDEEPVCVLRHKTNSVQRRCMRRELYNKLKNQSVAVTMCEKSGCKAE